jgi:hypothetical protein
MKFKAFLENSFRWAFGILFLVAPVVYFWQQNQPPSKSQIQTADFESKSVIESGYQSFASDIYTSWKEVTKIPRKVATPFVLYWKVEEVLDDLEKELDPQVRKRVLESIDSDEFVNEVVPFLFSLKEQYAPGFGRSDSFADYIKSYFSKQAPGAVHTLFEYEHQKAAAGESKPSLFSFENKKMMAQMITLYDAIFLRPNVSPLLELNDPTPETIRDVQKIVTEFLKAMEKSMDPKSYPAEAIRHNLAHPEKLETLTITLITSVSIEAYKAYSVFASKVSRMENLRNWMKGELKKRHGGKLWDYLRYANEGRKYGVQIVVDGLQGHLIRSLALNKYNGPFMKQLKLDQEGPSQKPSGIEVRETTRPQQFHFLKSFQEKGITGPSERYLPHFRTIANRYEKSFAIYGTSSTPTISVRNLPIAWTGAPVAGPNSSGVPNFHFVDRRGNKGNGRAYYFFGNDAVLLERLTKESGMKTMFERLSGVVSVNCNAQYDSGAKSSFNPFLNLALGEKIRNFGDTLCMEIDLKARIEVEAKLRTLRADLLDFQENFQNDGFWIVDSLHEYRAGQIINQISELEDMGMPQYMLYYNPWSDHFAHGKGPFSDEVLSPTGELNRLDYWIGRMQEAYKKAGVYNRTLFAIAGDHGLTPVKYQLNPEVEIFDALNKDAPKGKPRIIVEKISSDEGEGPKMNNPLRPPSMRGKDVVIASTAGGNYMLDFFMWDLNSSFFFQPLYSDLKSWKTIAGERLPILNIITEKLKDSLDYLVVREEPSFPHEGKVRLMAYRDGKLANAFVTRKKNRILYQFESDLLDVKQPNVYSPEHYDKNLHQSLLDKCLKNVDPHNPESWCAEEDWTLLTSFTNRQDSVVQIAHLYDTDRAGTVNLFPKAGIGYNTIVPGRHAGEHFHEKDAMVAFWGAPTAKASQQLRTAANGSLAPTIYEWITGKKPEVGKDGWGYPSLLNKVTK